MSDNILHFSRCLFGWCTRIGLFSLLIFFSHTVQVKSEDKGASEAVRVRIFSPYKTLAPHQKFSLALQIEIEQGWHIYWKEPGRFGLPTILQVLLNGTEVEGQERWAVPDRKMFEDGGLSYEYREPFTVLVGPFQAPPESGVLEVQVRGRWLACTADLCVPKNGAAEVHIPVEKGGSEESERKEFLVLQKSLPKLFEGTFLFAPGGSDEMPLKRVILSVSELLQGGLGEFAGIPQVVAYGGDAFKFEGGKFVGESTPGQSIELVFSSRGGASVNEWQVRQLEGFLFFDERVAAFRVHRSVSEK